MPRIGDYAQTKDYTTIDPDIYPATITVAEVVMDKDNPALPFTDKWGKNRLRIKVELDNETDAAGGPVEIQRQLPISYGATAGTYAALATLIQAALGIPCGDKAQRHVTTEQLIDRSIRVQTDNVSRDDKVYTNIVAFFPPKKKSAAPLAAAPAPKRAPIVDLNPPLDDDELDDEAPF